MSLSTEAIATLSHVSTATITTVLLKKGLRNIWMRGTKPLKPGLKRLVGPAFTLRFVPAREDLATPESWSSPISTRTAIEAMPAGCIAVVDAMGITDAGIFGDILCARMVKRGVTALITDGVVRDVEGVLGTGLPADLPAATARLVKRADKLSAYFEATLLAGFTVQEAETLFCRPDGATVDPYLLRPLPAGEVEALYIERFSTLDTLAKGAAVPVSG